MEKSKVKKKELLLRLERLERELSTTRDDILIVRERYRGLREFLTTHFELPPEPSDYTLLRRIDGGGGV